MSSSRRDFLKAAGAAAFLGTVGLPAHVQAAPATPWDAVPAILARIKPPTFAARDFAVTSYGGKGDGKADNTKAFRDAVQACNKAGGGRVVVPKGTFLTGPIHLLSDVNLHVEAGATIRFSTDRKKYLPVVFTRWQGIECYNWSPFIYGHGLTNVAVTGKGTLDGQGDSWKPLGSGGSSWRSLQQMAEDNRPVAQRRFGDGHTLRPNMIQLYRCTNVLIADVKIVKPPMWTIHPVLSTNVTVRGVTVQSRGGGGNNDGCDPESCTDVHIVGCTFETGDDCIAIKSGRDVEGRRINVPSQNIVIQDCTFVFSNRGAICIGSEASGGARQIFAENCRVNPANSADAFWYALFIKTNNLRGGVTDGVYLRNITGAKFMKDPVFITANYSSPGPGPVVQPTIQNIEVDNVTMRDIKGWAVNLDGRSGATMRRITVSNSTFTNTAQARPRVSNATDVTFTNVRVNGDPV
jgi:polygalacturonase